MRQRMKILLRASLLTMLVCLLLATSGAQSLNPIAWSLSAGKKDSIKPGDKISVQVNGQISPGWHLYSLTQPAGGPSPTRITLPDGQPFTVKGSISGPHPHVEMDQNFGINTETYEGSVTFTIPVISAATARPGQPRSTSMCDFRPVTAVCVCRRARLS